MNKLWTGSVVPLVDLRTGEQIAENVDEASPEQLAEAIPRLVEYERAAKEMKRLAGLALVRWIKRWESEARDAASEAGLPAERLDAVRLAGREIRVRRASEWDLGDLEGELDRLIERGLISSSRRQKIIRAGKTYVSRDEANKLVDGPDLPVNERPALRACRSWNTTVEVIEPIEATATDEQPELEA